MKRYFALACVGSCLVGFIFWMASCAVNPVSGKQELMLLSESDEIKLGCSTDPQGRINVEPDRLRIQVAPRSGTLETVLRSWASRIKR